MYCPNDPSTAYPPLRWFGQRVSHPVWQYSHSPQADQSQALPTRSPTATRVTSAPTLTTCPTPS